MPIKLTSSDENVLNFHYTKVERRVAHVDITDPSPSAFTNEGKLSDKNRYFTDDFQKELIHHITGTGVLVELSPKTAKLRNNLYLPWVRGEPEGEEYKRIHLALELWDKEDFLVVVGRLH